MKINKTDFLNIKELLVHGRVTLGRFKNKKIVEQLKFNGSIKTDRPTPQREVIYLKKKENIFLFFKNSGYNISIISEIDSYIDDVIDSKPSRALLQQKTNSTKSKSSQSLKGLYLSSLKEIDIKINGEIVSIIPASGLGYFCFHTEKIEISKETIIVGVENYQVIWFAKKYREFFEKDNLLFVVINQYMREWISDLENEYIHFGDYDLAGINIYINDIVPKLKRCKKYSMFIPDNIERLIKDSFNNGLFEEQKKYKDLLIKDSRVDELRKIIIKYKKGLEQEGLYLM